MFSYTCYCQRSWSVVNLINIRNLVIIFFFFVVIAADGFTYERSAIENWLKSNDCSPMTNEKLAHKNLDPNLLIKEILNSISE